MTNSTIVPFWESNTKLWAVLPVYIFVSIQKWLMEPRREHCFLEWIVINNGILADNFDSTINISYLRENQLRIWKHSQYFDYFEFCWFGCAVWLNTFYISRHARFARFRPMELLLALNWKHSGSEFLLQT